MSDPAPTPQPVHAPEVGRSKRLLGAFHHTGAFWLRLHRVGVKVVPSWAYWPILVPIALLFLLALGRVRRALANNLEVVLGPGAGLTRLGRSWCTIHAFSWCLSERFERLCTRRSFAITAVNEAAWHEVAATGEGFVMVSAHVGNYEVGSMLPSTEEQRHVHLVREPEMDPGTQQFVSRLLDDLPGGEHYSWHFESDQPLHGLPLLHALRRGEIVAMQGDRPRTGAKVVECRLFGRPFPLPAGPLTLARSAEVAVLPVFVLREGRRRYRLHFRTPFRVARTADREADVADAAQRLATEVEWAIRQQPHQWFCFRDVWP